MSEQPPRLDLCCTLPASAKAVDTDLFEVKEVADGVYAAIAAPQYKLNSNAAIILTNDGVVVVDSHSKPRPPRLCTSISRASASSPCAS